MSAFRHQSARFLRGACIGCCRGYQKLWGNRGHCRYIPSCSDYMIESLQRWGLVKGLYKGGLRILRCHPWGGWGIDFPKEKDSCH
ncbi:MAG: membrane protein insertion efficiency factor YidD [Holosporales bacterium]|jgi:putative membrane protein insertion efficiency factor|nr:membrane protein insertion efficiency factor YidD [Holosporales bacterium]